MSKSQTEIIESAKQAAVDECRTNGVPKTHTDREEAAGRRFKQLRLNTWPNTAEDLFRRVFWDTIRAMHSGATVVPEAAEAGETEASQDLPEFGSPWPGDGTAEAPPQQPADPGPGPSDESAEDTQPADE